jgi:hypothetical protein
MSYNPTSPLPGAAVTGFTSPTFTLSNDVAPSSNGIQKAVTALGGTQPSEVDTHTVSRPFTLTVFKPPVVKQLPAPNPGNGRIANVPVNRHSAVIRKGVTPLVGQPPAIASIRVQFDIPAGSDTADPENLRALYSAAIGLLYDQCSELAEASITNVY